MGQKVRTEDQPPSPPSWVTSWWHKRVLIKRFKTFLLASTQGYEEPLEFALTMPVQESECISVLETAISYHSVMNSCSSMPYRTFKAFERRGRKNPAPMPCVPAQRFATPRLKCTHLQLLEMSRSRPAFRIHCQPSTHLAKMLPTLCIPAGGLRHFFFLCRNLQRNSQSQCCRSSSLLGYILQCRQLHKAV